MIYFWQRFRLKRIESSVRYISAKQTYIIILTLFIVYLIAWHMKGRVINGDAINVIRAFYERA